MAIEVLLLHFDLWNRPKWRVLRPHSYQCNNCLTVNQVFVEEDGA